MFYFYGVDYNIYIKGTKIFPEEFENFESFLIDTGLKSTGKEEKYLKVSDLKQYLLSKGANIVNKSNINYIY